VGASIGQRSVQGRVLTGSSSTEAIGASPELFSVGSPMCLAATSRHHCTARKGAVVGRRSATIAQYGTNP
jgi:hypothetical protein